MNGLGFTSRRGSFLVALAAAAAMLALVALDGGPGGTRAFAQQGYGTPPVVGGTTNPTTGETTFPVSDATGATVSTAEVTLTIPPGALPAGVTTVSVDDDVTLPPGTPPPPGGTIVAPFSMTARDAAGNPFTGTFDSPFTITTRVPPEALAAAGGNAANLVLAFFNTNTNTWQQVPCTASGNTLTCQLSNLSLWGYLVRTGAQPPQQPGTGTTQQPGAGTTQQPGAGAGGAGAAGGIRPPATGMGPGSEDGSNVLGTWLAAGAVLGAVVLAAGWSLKARRSTTR